MHRVPDPNLPDHAFVMQLSDILHQEVRFDRGPLPTGRTSLWAFTGRTHGIIVRNDLSPIVARIAFFDAVARPLLGHHHRILAITQQNIEADYFARALVRRIFKESLQTTAHDRIFSDMGGMPPLESVTHL